MDTFDLPVCLTVKSGALHNLEYELEKCIDNVCNRKILIVTSKELIDLFSKELEIMKNISEHTEIYTVDLSSFDEAVELAKYLSIKNFRLVIGFGGGKVLDTTKYASYIAKVKYICIPTTLSHDGLASPIAVLTAQEGIRKSFGCIIPTGIIVDIDIIMAAPAELLKAGIGDTVSNYTALYDWKLDRKQRGKDTNDFAYLLSDMSFNLLFYNEDKSLTSKSFIKTMTESLVLSGLAMEIAGNSRPCSGSEHLFSHALDEYYNDIRISHGMAVALGSIVACILQERDYKLLLDYLNAYQISVNPENWGITREIFIDAWMKAKYTRKDRFTVLNMIDLTEEKLSKIYDIVMEETK